MHRNTSNFSSPGHFQTAFKPQITKSYANNDFEYLFNLMFSLFLQMFYKNLITIFLFLCYTYAKIPDTLLHRPGSPCIEKK
jgi:hypothetical protein